MTEAKFKRTDGTFVTVSDIDLSHAPEIVGIEPSQNWTLYTESSEGSDSVDFVGEKSTRERSR